MFLPFQYRPQKKSYMDSEIFSDYVRKHDIKFHAEGRKVALIIDNSLANPNVDNLKATELVFSHTAHPPKITNYPRSHQSIENFQSHKCCETPD